MFIEIHEIVRGIGVSSRIVITTVRELKFGADVIPDLLMHNCHSGPLITFLRVISLRTNDTSFFGLWNVTTNRSKRRRHLEVVGKWTFPVSCELNVHAVLNKF